MATPRGTRALGSPERAVTQLVRDAIAGRHDVRGLAAVLRVRTLAIHGHRSSDRDNLVHRGSAFEASREPADLELSVEGWSTPLAIFTKQALSSLVSVGPARECTKEDLWLASGLLARPRSRHTTSSPMIASPSKQALCKPSWRPSSDL